MLTGPEIALKLADSIRERQLRTRHIEADSLALMRHEEEEGVPPEQRTFDFVSRSRVSLILNHPEEVRVPSAAEVARGDASSAWPPPGVVYALAQIAYDGGLEAFVRDTGYPAPGTFALEPTRLPPQHVPLYVEGFPVPKQRFERVATRSPHTHFVIEATSEGVLEPGTLGEARRLSHPNPEPFRNHAMVLRQRDNTLKLAWYLGDGRYVTRRGGEPFHASASDVFGVVLLATPRLRGAPEPEPERACQAA